VEERWNSEGKEGKCAQKVLGSMVRKRYFRSKYAQMEKAEDNGANIQWVPDALTPGVKRPGREADHSRTNCAEVSITWICTSTPPYVFTAQCSTS
jgi:hypothetical protein